ncbi:hypothetical protein F5Y15DRAFT_294060 [Xylariaceae sp. FL0016]|nr:hypothetical protein F5Y15DRAFT_294060 [Xylariaceae sp. FL0016]
MADASNRSIGANTGSNRARRVRGQHPTSGGSRNSSARSSAIYYEDPAQSQPLNNALGYASLRSTSSRFSLNEQFAATRRDFEFDFDDASSVLERGTVASQPLDESEADDTVVVDHTRERNGSTPTRNHVAVADYYDLLCVPRDPSAQTIRRAYFRLFTLLHPDMHPPQSRTAAEAYFAAVQAAFETLLDPCRRLQYDEHSQDRSLDGSSSDQEYEAYLEWHDKLKQCLLPYDIVDGRGLWELGARFDAQQIFGRALSGHRKHDISPVDFEMRHSISIGLPGLDEELRRARSSVWAFLNSKPFSWQSGRNDTVGSAIEDHHGRESWKRSPSSRNGTVAEIQGSIYGFLQNISLMPFAILLDHYQPSFPTARNVEQSAYMRDGRVQPLVSAKMHHRLSAQIDKLPPITRSPDHVALASTEAVEIEAVMLPKPAISTRLIKGVVIPGDRQPSSVQVAANSALWNRQFPRLFTSLQRPTAGGVVMCSVDSGDWRTQAEDTCRFFSDFTKVHKKTWSLDLSLHTPPKIDIAYKIGGAFEQQDQCIPCRLTDHGLRGLDRGFDCDKKGSWTVSATAEPNWQSASIKYGRDVDIVSFARSVQDRVSSGKADVNHTGVSPPVGRKFRMEAEVSSNSLWAGYLALRCLKRVGRFSKAGFEIGLSTYSLSLSLYWSRLGQRINLPFIICSRANLNTHVAFWTTFVPFAGFTAWEAIDRYRRYRRHQRRSESRRDCTASLQEAQNAKRTEADQLTSLMYTGVQNRQRAEYVGNGLVVLSAKYGVKAKDSETNAWGAEEVADVTVAVAALIDGGRLCIPAGVRKANILGFWDPAPEETKILHVRYSYKNKEATVEMAGDQETLVLPPVGTE